MPTAKPLRINHSRLLPVSPVVTKLLKFFSHHWDFILKREGESWYTETRYILNPRNFESYWQDPKISLGLRFGSQTKFGCLDLDKNSKNNPLVNPKRYRRLIKALRKIGIKRTVLIRSSSNRGVHLFFFLPDGVNSFDLACALFRVLSENCFEIKAGQLEIFPNTKRYKKKGEGFSLFNGLRVPMQPGSGSILLDPKTFEPLPGGAEEFVKLMNASCDRQDFKLLKECCDTARDWYCNFALNKQSRTQWQKDIEYSLRFGFTGSGQTNDILKNLANLGRVFYGASTVADLAKFIHERVIDLPGYLDHCGHQDEIEKRAFEWATSAINYWSIWASNPQRKQNFTELWAEQEQLSGVEPVVTNVHKGRWGLVNQKRSDETMIRLRTILDEYPLGTMPRGVLKRLDFINEKCQVMFGTKFSRNTLSKTIYRDLWHPKYTQEVITQKELGFSFKLAMGCIKAIAHKVVITIELLINSINHNTDKQQSQNQAKQTIQKAIAPPGCSINKNDPSKTAKIQTTQKLEQSDRTFMKCVVGLTPYLAYRVFILKLELIKEKLKQHLESLFIPEIKTSETKFQEIRRARRKNSYFYHGIEVSSRSGLTRRGDELISLKPGTKVKILTDFHSSAADAEYERQEVKKGVSMQPSIHQRKVIDWLQADSNFSDAVVNSVAGSGKSTLLKLAADAISSSNVDVRDCLVLVFNKKNKTALVQKLDSRWQYSISTVHSAGYRVLKKYLGVRRLEVEEGKYRHLAKTLDWFNGSNPKQAKVVSLSSFLKLFEFVRLTLSPLTPQALSELIEHYALDINKQHLVEISQRIDYLFKVGMDSAASEAAIDHTDMLWLPVVWQINQSPGFKYAQRVMVDEAQDMSRLQLEFVLSLAHSQAKMLFVGDPAQSINGFCGADTDSFSNIQTRLQAQEFTLPVCYRCPKTHIELINKLCPEIPIEPRENAPTGSIKTIQEWDLWSEAKDSRITPGDLVIARCSSSLVDLHLKMVVRGIPCNLVGSSLQQDLLHLLEDIAEQTGFEYQKFAQFSQSYLKFKQSIYQENDNGAILLLQLKDQIKAIEAIYNHFQSKSLAELASSIKQLFGSEDDEAVLLSTVHRAKGMESERVYIAEPLTLPLIWEGQKQWQEQQEQNLLYVALSRSTKDLFLIGDAFWFDGNKSSQQNLVSTDDTSADSESDLVEARIVTASNEELEHYAKLIRLEQGKRVELNFSSLF